MIAVGYPKFLCCHSIWRSAATKSMSIPRGKCWGWAQKLCQVRHRIDLSGPVPAVMLSAGWFSSAISRGQSTLGRSPLVLHLLCLLSLGSEGRLRICPSPMNRTINMKSNLGFSCEISLIKNKCFIPIIWLLYRTQKVRPVSSANTCAISPLSPQKKGVRRGCHRTCHTWGSATPSASVTVTCLSLFSSSCSIA